MGMVFQEIREMVQHEPKMSYFFKWWNVTTVIMLTLFVMAGACWIAGNFVTGDWSITERALASYDNKKNGYALGYTLLLLGNSFFAMATIVSVFHLLDLCQVRCIRKT